MPQVGPVRLTLEQHEKLQQVVAESGRTQADVLREAVLTYIDGNNSLQDDARLRDRDQAIADALQAIESRFASFLVHHGVDLEAMYALAFFLTKDQPDQKKMFKEIREVGLARCSRKLQPRKKTGRDPEKEPPKPDAKPDLKTKKPNPKN